MSTPRAAVTLSIDGKKKQLEQELGSKEFASTEGVLEGLIRKVETRFAAMFTHDDVREARGELLVKQRALVDWGLFLMGIRVGITLILAFWLVRHHAAAIRC